MTKEYIPGWQKMRVPRRYFFQAQNEMHYEKRGKMNNHNDKIQDPVQDSIDSLNAAIDRLSALIKKND
jgi:hypothetical protein